MSRPLPDGGLQAERTALAWRRTALAMAVAAVGAGRLAAPVLGAAAFVVAAAGLLQAVLVAASARRRYRAARASLAARGDLTGLRRGGLPMAGLACSGALVGLLALGVVLGG
jgi:putative membrane protein